jgi:hypothetical protein
MATVDQQLKDAKKKLKALETATFDRGKNGYTIAGYKSPLTVVQLEEEKRTLRETTIPNLEKGVSAVKQQAGPTSNVPAKKFVSEQLQIELLSKKIEEERSKPNTFDNLISFMDLLAQKRDLINAGVEINGKKVAFTDKADALKKVNDDIIRQTNLAESLVDTDLGTTREVKSGKGAAATRRVVRDLSPEEAKIKQDRLNRLSSFTGGAPTGPTPSGRTAAVDALTGGKQPTGPSGPTGATGPSIPTGSTGPTKPGKPATPPTVGGGATVTVDGKKVKVGSSQWQTIIQQEFGSLWDVYNDNADVKKVIDKSVTEGWYNDQLKLTESLRNTNWFRATQSSARQYKIQQSTDPATIEDNINKTIAGIRAESNNAGVVLADTTLRMLAENKLKYGWNDLQTTNAIGSEAVATANRGGAQGMADLRKGSTGTNLRMIADDYGIKPTDTMLDQWVTEIMQGTKTDVQFTDLMKQQASAQYRSLAPLIEKGQTVKNATMMYSNSAQAVLGTDPNTIDWSQDKWNRALNYQDPKTGEYRQMDSWEWNRYLRQQPEWQNTDDAKSIYRNAAFSLAQAFGKVQ